MLKLCQQCHRQQQYVGNGLCAWHAARTAQAAAVFCALSESPPSSDAGAVNMAVLTPGTCFAMRQGSTAERGYPLVPRRAA
jgi:hypothetical protein